MKGFDRCKYYGSSSTMIGWISFFPIFLTPIHPTLSETVYRFLVHMGSPTFVPPPGQTMAACLSRSCPSSSQSVATDTRPPHQSLPPQPPHGRDHRTKVGRGVDILMNLMLSDDMRLSGIVDRLCVVLHAFSLCA